MKTCSLDEHYENESSSFCQECKIYMCNECEQYHSKLFKNHHLYKIKENQELSDIFTEFCKEEGHFLELKYFCKTHNTLCCAECISKVKTKESGQQKDCDVCSIKDIEDEKKKNLKENIKCLENLSFNLQQHINELKKEFEKLVKNKEELKMDIQIIFTKMRNVLNDREEELLSDLDKKFNEIYFDENLIRKSETLTNNVKLSIEKGKEIINKWDKNKLNSIINDCLNVENNIKNINEIKKGVQKCNSLNFNIEFYPDNDEENEFIQIIKNFGKINKDKIFDSKIEFDENLVKSRLDNRKFNAELLFRKTIDGSITKDFHNKCDNKGITIILLRLQKDINLVDILN